jgi:hypothetical protein
MSEILQTIRRLRRAMPRNPDVMDACDWIDRAVAAPRVAMEAPLARPDPTKPKLTRAQIQKNYRDRLKDRRKAEERER